MTPYLLLALGLLLIFLEFFLPGAILGSLGLCLLVASVVLFAMLEASPLALFFYVCTIIIAVIALVQLALWRIRRSSSKASFYLATDQTGYRADQYDIQLIGQEGTAVTDLRPAGRIAVGTTVLQAMSQGSFIAKGSRVVITGGEGATLIVKPFKEELPPC